MPSGQKALQNRKALPYQEKALQNPPSYAFYLLQTTYVSCETRRFLPNKDTGKHQQVESKKCTTCTYHLGKGPPFCSWRAFVPKAFICPLRRRYIEKGSHRT